MASRAHASRPQSEVAHQDLVQSVAEGGAIAEGGAMPPILEPVSGSWRRCAVEHRIDADKREPPRICTEQELSALREPIEGALDLLRPDIDRLYAIVRHVNYVLLLTTPEGVVVEHRGNEAEAEQFRHWGTWLGGVWSEDVEGTNGIGTCIAERRPITVHRDQHFRTRHANLSCSGAPIFAPDGGLAGVLDVSSIDPATSDRSHALTLAVTVDAARAISERQFRARFRRNWVVALTLPDAGDQVMLLAVDGDQRVLGADHAARRTLAIDDERLRGGLGLWTIFSRNPAIFRDRSGNDVAVRLTRIGDAEDGHALITPPEGVIGTWRSAAEAEAHLRPRTELLGNRWKLSSPASFRGGLPPSALRRVHDYIEAHLEENLGLELLAATAGLSMYHFSRAFKQSVGIPPHSYLLQRRIERAKELLLQTELPLSEVALAVGFSDQSHFTRHFRRVLGVVPSRLRWDRR